MFGTDTIKFDKKSVKTIAHKGCSGIECENTCASFVLAGSKSYFGIETDMHKTADGKYIICHDRDVFRMTGVHKIIEESPYSELEKLKLASPVSGETRVDLVFPLLEDYIKICKKYNKQAILELKADFDAQSISEICGVINSLGYFYRVTFISFYGGALLKTRNAYPDADLQLLTVDRIGISDFEFMKKYNISLDAAESCIDKSLVDEIHAAKLKINCWTVDDVRRAEILADYGVDFITTNILE